MRVLRGGSALLLGGFGACIAGWVTLSGAAWLRYGRPAVDGSPDEDLQRFMPAYEVMDRHQILVEAPADVTFAKAMALDMQQSPLIRGIFRAREVLLRAPNGAQLPAPFLQQMQALGWEMLVHQPGQLLVMGAVTRPWEKHVIFRGLAPDAFASFYEPDYVKIVWSIEVRPLTASTSLLRTITRAQATDANARRKFRNYWAIFSPGIGLVRYDALRIVRAQAELEFTRFPSAL